MNYDKSITIYMNKFIAGVFVFFAFFGIQSTIKDDDHIAEKSEMIYTVERVVDGDTVIVRDDNSEYIVRLIGVDAPESSRHRFGYIECYGEESKEFAQKTLNGQMVTIQTDESQASEDKYGRMLGHIILGNGENFNSMLIRSGFAKHYVYEHPSMYHDQYFVDESNAKKEKIGMWSCEQS